MDASITRQTLGDLLRRTAGRVPEKPAIVCGEVSWTFREFDTVVSRLAAGLHAQGVAQGEHVGVLARNSHGFAALRLRWPGWAR
jgi:fatty-acyl-CoA synthase